MERNLQGILPSSVIHKKAEPKIRQEPGPAVEDEGIHGGIFELIWCGDTMVILSVVIDGDKEAPWVPSQMGATLRMELPEGDHICTISDVVGEGDDAFKADYKFSIAKNTTNSIETGVLFEKVVSDPRGRSQYSFEGGRSACTFLTVTAAIRLTRKMPGGEISSCEVVPEDIEHILDDGMQRYLQGGGRDMLEAAGLEHANINEVLQMYEDYGNEWAAEQNETFWGNLCDEQSVEDALLQLNNKSKGQGVMAACFTRPPESVLIVCNHDAGLFGVIDTHRRYVGNKQYPASFFQCKSLKQLSGLIRHTLFPLPQGMEVEELGMYAMFEMTPIKHVAPQSLSSAVPNDSSSSTSCSKSTRPGADSQGHVSDGSELDPDSLNNSLHETSLNAAGVGSLE